MGSSVITVVSDFVYIASGDGLQVNSEYDIYELKAINSDRSLSADDLTDHLLTLLWPIMIIWM